MGDESVVPNGLRQWVRKVGKRAIQSRGFPWPASLHSSVLQASCSSKFTLRGSCQKTANLASSTHCACSLFSLKPLGLWGPNWLPAVYQADGAPRVSEDHVVISSQAKTWFRRWHLLWKRRKPKIRWAKVWTPSCGSWRSVTLPAEKLAKSCYKEANSILHHSLQPCVDICYERIRAGNLVKWEGSRTSRPQQWKKQLSFYEPEMCLCAWYTSLWISQKNRPLCSSKK